MAELSLVSCSVDFGGLKALTSVTLDLAEKGVHGLIGPNGAGKSTCINVMTGYQRTTSGLVQLGDTSLGGLSPETIRKMGVSRTFQGGRLFSALTVCENVAAAFVGLGRRRAQADKEALELLEWMGLSELRNKKASALPYTDQRRTAIARALAGRPKVLLLDEPATGMSAAEADGLITLIRRISSELGISVMLVEHNVSLVFSLCDDITVLDGGVVIAKGEPEQIRGNNAVREAYLGTQAGSLVQAARP